jgi:hypothetical protein
VVEPFALLFGPSLAVWPAVWLGVWLAVWLGVTAGLSLGDHGEACQAQQDHQAWAQEGTSGVPTDGSRQATTPRSVHGNGSTHSSLEL